MGASLARRRGRRALSEINVTPFVDVMLVLLIIFMVTAPLMQQGIDVDLPETSTQPLRVQNEPLIVSVKKSNPSVPCSRWPVPEAPSPPNGKWTSPPSVGAFTCTIPVLAVLMYSWAWTRSRVYTDDESPNSTSFEIFTASCKSDARNTLSTGPKISSRAVRMLVFTSVNIVGST